MGLMVQVIWQLINLCTIAVFLPVPGSSGSIVQSPALSPSIKSPVLHQTIRGPLLPLLPGQSTTLATEHTLAAAVPSQPFHHSAALVTAETPHGSPYLVPKPPHDSVPPLPEETPHEQLPVSPPPTAESPLISSVPPASDPSHGLPQAPASDALPALALPPAARPHEAIAPLPHVHSSSSPPLMAPLPLVPPPFFPSPPIATELPHTSAPTMAAMPPIAVSPIPIPEPPSLEGQPFFHSPSPASPPDSPPATTMVSPPVSPPLPQQIPSRAPPPDFIVHSHAFVPAPLMVPPLQEVPPIIPLPLSAEPPHASAMSSPPLLSDASSPMPQPVPLGPSPPKFTLPFHTFAPPPLTAPLLPVPPPTFFSPPHTLPPYASTLEPPQLAPLHPSPPDFVAPPRALIPPPSLPPRPLILASPPVPLHASFMPFPPFPFQASSPPLQMVPSHASPPTFEVPTHALVPPPLMAPPLHELPPIITSPLPAEPPHASAMLSPPLLSNVSPPMPQPFPLGPPPPKFVVPSHTFAPSPLTVPLPPEPPSTFLSPTHTLPPYTSTLEPPQLAPLHPSPPDFVAPPHALVPPPLIEPLPPEPSPFLASPPIPPHASSMLFPPFPSLVSPPPLQMVPSHASPPTFEVPSHALAPPSLRTPLPKGPPSVLPSPQRTMAPRASTMQPPSMPPLESAPFPEEIPPHASPTTLFVPPPSSRPPHAFAMPPPIELPHTYPPLTILPGAVPPYASPPALVLPPLAPAPLIMPYPPYEKSHNYAPHSPTMQGTAPSVSPHVSQRKEIQNGTLPPVQAIEPSPSSRISPRGAPSVHQVRSHPPISHQIEAPNPNAPFWRSNASVPHLPPLPISAPINNTNTSGVPLSAPPSYETISSIVPPAAPPSRAPSQLPPANTSHHGSATILVPPPFSSRVHSPGISPFISPSTPNFTRPSSLAPMPAALSPQSSAREGSHPSVASPSPSIQNHPRDDVRSLGPASISVPSPTPSWLGQAGSPSPLYAPKASQVVGQKYNPSSPPSQGSPTAMVPLPSPSRVPEISPVSSSIPYLSPKISPSGSSTRDTKRPITLPIRALPPPPPNQDCAYMTCLEPLTNTPPGSPCGCVEPMQVGLRLSVTLYIFFPLLSELAREIATGVSMNQSQVRVMGANSAGQEPEKTIVIIDLVPLNGKFDNTTAISTSQKFWHKQVAIDKSKFGDYDVIYVHYQGLPPSPPIPPSDISVINGMPYSVGDPNGSKLHPLGVDVPKQKHKNKLNGSLVAVIVFSAIVGVLICGSVAWVLIFRRASRNHQSAQTPRAGPSLARSSGPTGHSNGSGPSSPLSFGSSLAAYKGSARTFSANEIEKATANFNPSGILGEGGFGCVYHGILEDGTGIAVKVPKRDDQRGGKEFLAEVEMLSRLHHRNLVRLIGICIEERMRCLVYELVPNGSVDSHLHGPDKETSPLDWTSRLKIALGAARGLAYLHEDSSPRVIHRDFKASNILLDSDFTPKVSDFGLARNALDEENRHISTHVMGTFGYVAPEYAMTGHLLVKSDVYSYGVVLLELLTGRKPVDMSQPPGQENLVTWTRPLLTTTEGLESIVDTSLGPDVALDSVAKVAAIASMCVQPEVSHRPFMGEVVQALKLVCNECDDSKDGEDSRNLSRENLSIEFDDKPGTSPHAGETREPLPDQLSSHGFPTRHDIETGLSVSEIFSVSARECRQSSGLLHRQSASGPIRTPRRQGFWKRIRRLSQGSVSEHGIMYRSWARSH